jgi:hypothetical protein
MMQQKNEVYNKFSIVQSVYCCILEHDKFSFDPITDSNKII